MERRREEEWSFGEQKLVQTTSQTKGLTSQLVHAAFKALYLGLVRVLQDLEEVMDSVV